MFETPLSQVAFLNRLEMDAMPLCPFCKRPHNDTSPKRVLAEGFNAYAVHECQHCNQSWTVAYDATRYFYEQNNETVYPN